MYSDDSDYKRWIHSARWRQTRLRQLAEHPYCERCAAANITTIAKEVHHRRPVLSLPSASQREAEMFNASNLMSLCHECHKAEHRDMGKQSQAEQRKRDAERLGDFCCMYGIDD